MTDVTISAAVYSIQSAKPSQKYGQLALVPFFQSTQSALVRMSLAGIPSGATILSATLKFVQGAAVSGTHSLTASRVTGAWPSSVTWGTTPAATATGAVTVSKSSPAAGVQWAFDVTALVQTFVTGTNPNIGFLITKNQASKVTLNGTPASTGKPVLAITYSLLPSTPANLHPSAGAVSIAKPTVTFDADDDVLSIQVQIDPASNPTTPAFDSLEVPATAGLLDLTLATPGGTYAGLSNAATTTWRARQKNASGWSPWSSWATFSRTNKSALAITAPTSTPADGTPPTTWTFAGTQTAWQARLLNASGAVLADSGRTVGTALAWTPLKGLLTNGQTGTIEVRVWDNVNRESTPGDPAYTIATLGITLTLSGAVTPVTTLNVTQDGTSPVVTLTGTRASIPDEVQVFIDGAKVSTYVGTDVFVGTTYTIKDLSAPMNKSVTYRVAAVVNSVVASGGPSVVYTPQCDGIWLFDESDHTKAVPIWGNGAQNQAQPELSIVHTPIPAGDSDDDAQVVRRRLVRYQPQGDVVGTLLDARSVSAVASEALLNLWVDYDAGHLFRLVMGNLNRTVIIGDLNFSERPDNNEVHRVLDIGFNWWSQS